jgi:hypothetical protein
MSSICSHPFFRDCDREAATLYTLRTRLPVLRNSSLTGKYAFTFYSLTHSEVVHLLIVEDPDGSIENISESGHVYSRHDNIHAFLEKAGVTATAPSQPIEHPMTHVCHSPPGGEDPI